MLRHVIAPSSGWTKASHTVVRDRRINSNAKILILYVQGLPDSATSRPLGELALKLDMKGRPYQQAKKQLVEHGYVHEWRGQREDGLWATDQLFTNTPLTRAEARAVWTRLEQDAGRSPGVRYPTVGEPTPRSVGGYQPEEDHGDKTTPHPPSEAERERERGRRELAADPEPDPEAVEADPDPEPAAAPAEAAPEPAPAPHPTSQLAKAERLLLSLRHTRRDLLLGVREARALAVEAVKWLEGGLPEGDLRQALLADPPEGGVRSAVGFLRHRLIQKCPVTPLPAPTPPPPVRELMVCTGPGEEHVFRPLTDEAECADCRRATAYASWMVDTDTYEFPEDMTWRQRVAAVRKADELRAAGRSPQGDSLRGDSPQGDSLRGDSPQGDSLRRDSLRGGSLQGDAGDDGQMVAAGGGQGADVAHGGGTGHDLVDPGHREGGGEAEGEPALRKAQL